MLRPFFTYYGGKWRAAGHYPDPLCDLIVEPFAGAAGYALRHPERDVLLIDKNPRVARLWSWLTTVDPDEVRSIPLWSADFQTVDDMPVCAAARDLVGFWLNKGCAAPAKIPGAWMRGGARPASFWGAEIRERIASQVANIRHWRVQHADYTAAPDVRATWFVDPPYEKAGRHYVHGSGSVDFKALGAWCRGLRGQVVVCEAEGAEWLPFEPFRRIKANESRTGGRVSREALWTSGDR